MATKGTPLGVSQRARRRGRLRLVSCVTLHLVRTLRSVASLPEEHTSWTKALGGDSYGFAAVFDCHRDRVYRHALRLTGNAPDAEDLTAGAFLKSSASKEVRTSRRRNRAAVAPGHHDPPCAVLMPAACDAIER